MSNIVLNNPVCFICNRPNQPLTQHHAIPQHMQSKNNVLINICESCHKRLNNDDVAGMFAHAHKLNSSAEKLSKETKILYTIMSRWMTGSDDPNIIYDQNAWLEAAKERRIERAKDMRERQEKRNGENNGEKEVK